MYPTSSDVSAGQPTASAHYNNLRSDALRFGETESDSVTLAELFSRYEHNLRIEYLASNRLRVPGSVTAPVGIVINGIPLRCMANVDLSTGSAPSGAASVYFVFAIANPGSTTFTLDVNTSSAEGPDRRLIGSFYWDGSAIVQDSIVTEYSLFLESMLPLPRQHFVQGRLTLSTANPVPTINVDSTGTLYFTPYKGNKVSLYSLGRGKWITHSFSEMSISLSGIASGKNVDVFLYDNGGVLALNLVQWSGDLARSIALAVQDGVYVKNGYPGYLYLGTVRTSGAGVCEDTLRNRLVYNYYNRVIRSLIANDFDNQHNYADDTFRKWDNATNTDLALVVGITEDAIQFSYMASVKVHTAEEAMLSISADGSYDNMIAVVYTKLKDYCRFSGMHTSIFPAGYHNFYLCESGNDSGDGGLFDNASFNIAFSI